MATSTQKETDLRNLILERATRLFQLFGYHKLVMEDIARAVGKSRSTLYLYYKDKDAIFGAIVEREIKAYLAELTNELQQHHSAVERLRAYFRIKFNFRYAKATEYLIMNQEMAQQPEMVNRMRIYTDPPETDYLMGIIRYGIARDEFVPLSDEQIRLVTAMMISALHNIANDVLVHVETANVTSVQTLLQLLFVDGIVRH
jgi:AcrR family transcriptional regulator